jgi:hypothetical protein
MPPFSCNRYTLFFLFLKRGECEWDNDTLSDLFFDRNHVDNYLSRGRSSRDAGTLPGRHDHFRYIDDDDSVSLASTKFRLKLNTSILR